MSDLLKGRRGPRSKAGVVAADPQNPGMVLRKLRTSRGWTLAEVSKRTGLPISTLSKVETGKMSLTYDKLFRISRGFGVDISVLFGSEANEDQGLPQRTGRRSITLAGAGHLINTANYEHHYPAADLLNKAFIPIIAELKARSIEAFGPMVRHEGEEYAYVICGEVDLYTELYTPVRLGQGDSVYFDSGMAHAYVAASDEPCRVLSICSALDEEDLALILDRGPRDGSHERRPNPGQGLSI